MPKETDDELMRENFELVGQARWAAIDSLCPACGAQVIQEKCKVVCSSELCTYRVIQNCSEF